MSSEYNTILMCLIGEYDDDDENDDENDAAECE